MAFDLVNRPQYAWGILEAADIAAEQGLRRVTVIEFGVAAGAGLLNMAGIATRVKEATGVDVTVVGFDTGKGMPPPVDYRDHPEHYSTGDFAMDVDRLEAALPAHARLVLGDLGDTVPTFADELDAAAPVGFVAVDVDYWSSTVDALRLFEHAEPRCYLPRTPLFLDDITFPNHNRWCGELLAVDEFNERNGLRKIEHHRFLENLRVLRRTHWLKQIYNLHVLDHPARSTPPRLSAERVIDNPYLR